MFQSGKKTKDEHADTQPIGHSEDVEYAEELADAADIEAQKRANAADQRQDIRP